MKRTFTTIVCALLLVAVLAGCGSTGSTNPFDAKAKLFDAEGMQITLTTDFSQESLEGYTVGYAADRFMSPLKPLFWLLRHLFPYR